MPTVALQGGRHHPCRSPLASSKVSCAGSYCSSESRIDPSAWVIFKGSCDRSDGNKVPSKMSGNGGSPVVCDSRVSLTDFDDHAECDCRNWSLTGKHNGYVHVWCA